MALYRLRREHSQSPVDRAVFHRVADAMARSLLARVADVLARSPEPAGAVHGTGRTGAAARRAAAELS